MYLNELLILSRLIKMFLIPLEELDGTAVSALGVWSRKLSNGLNDQSYVRSLFQVKVLLINPRAIVEAKQSSQRSVIGLPKFIISSSSVLRKAR
jgi:hypothetical protein